MVTKRFLVDPQPSIPEGVDDLIVKSEADGRVWHIHSENQGIDRWMEVRRKWEMPEQMIEESKPDAVEYWREVCPYYGLWTEIDLQRIDGLWYWVIGGEDLRFQVKPEEMPKVGNRYHLGNHSIMVRGIVDNMVVYRRWYGNRYEYKVVDAWWFKAEVGILKKTKFQLAQGKGLKKMAKDRLSKEQERVLRALAAKDDWMSAYDLQCQMSTLYSLSSRRNYVVRDVMRGGDIAFPKQINWQITTVGREVVEQLDKEQADAATSSQ